MLIASVKFDTLQTNPIILIIVRWLIRDFTNSGNLIMFSNKY